MSNIGVNLEYSGISEKNILTYNKKVADIHKKMNEIANNENEFLGWLELPTNYDKEEYERIHKAAKRIRKNSDILIVIGIGGSYLGSKAVIEALSHNFDSMLPKSKRKNPLVMFAGQNISGTYLDDLLEIIEGKDISINVISKSGTTTEPAIAFRLFREVIENKYGLEGAKERIYITTDKERGTLKKLADEEGYETFVIPDNVGGRYSVLTPVGLLPIAVAGVDIDKLMRGARDAQEKYSDENLKYNECYKFAVTRNILYKSHKDIEILVNYEPRMHYFAEWWKQLFGESEGKELKGIFPASVDFTTDLHSMGQYIQQRQKKFI